MTPNNGGRSQPQTTAAAPTTPRDVPPPPTQEQVNAAAQRGMSLRYNSSTGAYEEVPMTSAQKSSRLDQQMAGEKDGTGVAPPQTQQPNIPGASTPVAAPAPVQFNSPSVAYTPGTGRPATYTTPGALPGTQPVSTNGPWAPQQPLQFSGPNVATSDRLRSAASTPAAPGGAGGAGFSPTTVDYSRYDQAAQGYDRAVQTFQGELDRLSGVDPFGNQAFLRKATDRAVGQASALASGGLSTATARAGNMRQAQGVQASLASQGIEQQAVQRNADENQAAQLRLGAAGGLANTLGAKAANEVELAKLQTQTMQTNVQQYLDKYKFDRALNQQDVESLRQAAIAYSQIDMQRYQTDVQYQAEVDKNILGKYVADSQLQGIMAKIKADEHITPGEFLMGSLGSIAGIAGGIATAPKGSMVNPTSDRRAKFDVRDPDLRDLEDFLGKTKGKLFRYREPAKPGRRPGLNFGPMAQDLAKSKIGRTVVTTDEEGTMRVDAARLALADHAALAALAAEVKALRGGGKQ